MEYAKIIKNPVVGFDVVCWDGCSPGYDTLIDTLLTQRPKEDAVYFLEGHGYERCNSTDVAWQKKPRVNPDKLLPRAKVDVVHNSERQTLEVSGAMFIYIPMTAEERAFMNVSDTPGQCWRISIRKGS